MRRANSSTELSTAQRVGLLKNEGDGLGGSGMERPRGLEPPPTAWQAVVLPLYYGRSTCSSYSMGLRRRQAPQGTTVQRHTPPRFPTVRRRVSGRTERANRPASRASPSPPAISSAARQTSRPWHGQCKRARISRRHGNRRSPASAGACAACLSPALFFFFFSRLSTFQRLHHRGTLHYGNLAPRTQVSR